MATSGSFNTTAYSGRYLQFTWKRSGVNVASNTSTITWTLKGAGSASVWYKAGNFKVVIEGETVYSSTARINLDNGTAVASGTYTLKHDANGTKSFTASAEAGIYTTAVNCTGSGTFTLDPIARASQPSCVTYPQHTQNVGNFGEVISIHMNRQSSAFTHTVRYAFGTKSGTCIDADTGKAATAVGTGFRWKIPEDFMNLLTATTTGSGTIYVDTYNGSTKIGTKWCGFTATVPSSVVPKCSVQVLDATNIQETYGNLVKGLSKLYVKTTGTPSYSSPIKAYSVTANDVRYTAAEVTTGVLTKAGTTTVTASVTDQRGRKSANATASFTVLDYASPAVTKMTAVRCNQDGTANRRGAYIKVVFSASITSLNSKNTAQYKVKYKKTTDSDYTSATITALSGVYAVTNHSYIFAASAGSSYDVVVEAIDRHHQSNPGTKSAKVPTASSVFSWRGFKSSSGTQDGAGIGKVPEKPNTLQVGWPAEFEDSLVQIGNKYSFSSPGVANTVGFVRMARISITAANADSPITFVFTQRRAISPMTVHVALTNSTTTASSLNSFTYEGTNYLAYLVKAEAMVWDLYVQKSSEWDTITMQDWGMSSTMESRCTVTFPGDLVDTVPQGLEGYHRATPTVLRSILDCVMPVGFVLTLYSHADPNDMYEGTTWVRITNGFLWATTATGAIGQTGGASEVTLTVNQIPSHTHGSVYSQHASGTKSQAWYTTAGTNLAYGTVATGGGEAHNNMPPYVQVSIWRRTA
jgi:hypothetical protein